MDRSNEASGTLKPGPGVGDLLPDGYYWVFNGVKQEYYLRSPQNNAVSVIFKGVTIPRFIFSKGIRSGVHHIDADNIHDARQIAECMIATGVIEL